MFFDGFRGLGGHGLENYFNEVFYCFCWVSWPRAAAGWKKYGNNKSLGTITKTHIMCVLFLQMSFLIFDCLFVGFRGLGLAVRGLEKN